MDYPGIDAVKRIAESRCAAGFHTNLIPESKRKDLNFRALVRPRTSNAESRSSTKTSLAPSIACS